MTAVRNSAPTRSWIGRNRLEALFLALGGAFVTTALIAGLLAL